MFEYAQRGGPEVRREPTGDLKKGGIRCANGGLNMVPHVQTCSKGWSGSPQGADRKSQKGWKTLRKVGVSRFHNSMPHGSRQRIQKGWETLCKVGVPAVRRENHRLSKKSGKRCANRGVAILEGTYEVREPPTGVENVVQSGG